MLVINKIPKSNSTLITKRARTAAILKLNHFKLKMYSSKVSMEINLKIADKINIVPNNTLINRKKKDLEFNFMDIKKT